MQFVDPHDDNFHHHHHQSLSSAALLLLRAFLSAQASDIGIYGNIQPHADASHCPIELALHCIERTKKMIKSKSRELHRQSTDRLRHGNKARVCMAFKKSLLYTSSSRWTQSRCSCWGLFKETLTLRTTTLQKIFFNVGFFSTFNSTCFGIKNRN